ncbi:MAG: MopE-related protein, partial [Myxococcota bacterium]|nr:MopE-related protein [Myxococcota bacterium]
NVYPGAEEICDGKDSDCDGYIPDDVDHDGDGYTLCDDDCDDDDPEIWPDNPEVCDGIDNDCSGSVDDIDIDGDGYSPCLINGDCDDNDPNAYPIVLDRAAPDEGDGSMEEPYNSLSDALDNLDPVCRTIVMMPGTYTMGLEWTEGFVAFNGGGDSNDQVVINPSGSRIIDLSNGASMRLSNLTLEGGQGAGDGGAIRVTGSDLELNNVLLQNNQSVGDGGAVALSSGTLTLNSSQFIENVSEDDGGAIALLSGTLIDNGSVFSNNTGIRGGAILLDVSDAFIYDSSFHSNNASGTGGSIEFSSGAALTIERSEFWLNSSAEMGGAISVVNHKSSGSVIRNNLFQDNSTLEKGGAISFSGFAAGLMLANNSFVANSSVLQGAAVYDEATDSSELYIWSNIFHANDGNYALYIAEGTAASLGYNTAFLTTSLVPWYYDDTVGPGNNTEEDPIFVQFTNDGDPTNDDLQLDATSPAIDAGPPDGAPAFYTDWNDLDGTQNDRGHLGGPGAAP